MQPTYLPWLGYFAMYDSVDRFVILDDVQFEYQSWQHRNRIKTPDKVSYITVPIDKQSRKSLITEAKISKNEDWQRTHLAQLRESYRRAPYLDEVLNILDSAFRGRHKLIRDLNMELMKRINDYIGIPNDRFVCSSEVNAGGVKVERLVRICKALGSTSYLSPPGSFWYIDQDNKFDVEGLDLQYFAYDHPQYDQLHGEFESHLSIVDLLLNKGPASLPILRSGKNLPLNHKQIKAQGQHH